MLEGVLQDIWIWFAQGLYSVCADLYALLLQIAAYEVVSGLVIRQIYLSVYTIIGIFMLFRLVYSFILYLTDPDKINDAKEGASKIIVRIVMAFVMLAFAPFVFTLLMDLQGAVLKENLIGRIFGFGEKTSTGFVVVSVPETQMNFGWLWTTKSTTEEKQMIMSQPTALANSVLSTFVSCQVSEEYKEKNKGSEKHQQDVRDKEAYCRVVADYPLLVSPTAVSVYQEEITYDMQFFPTIIIGFIFGALIAISCVDMAIRNVKLGVLQLMAPIPIMMYIDPKGGEMFDSWLKMLLKVYAELFLRLAIIYFITVVIGSLTTTLT